ncbi:sensor histidine kinase [Deinococcus humi]|nr:HAMP domain-containing sensor histidine kinase [Deinococcus humi]
MSRSLRTRLIVAFAAVSLPVLLLFAGGALLYARTVYLGLRQQTVREELVANIRTHVQLTGSLEGLRPQEPPPEERGQPPTAPSRGRVEPPPLIVLDPQFRVAVAATGHPQGLLIPVADRGNLTAVTLNARPVAYLLSTGTPPRPDAQTTAFVRRTAGLLLLAVSLATGISVLLGAWFSHRLLAPLRTLQGGVRALTTTGQAAPLPEGQPDELGELLRAFNGMSAELERRRISSRQFSADIAHDLSTPLTVMRGTLEAMKDGTLPATPERLSRLQTQTDHMIQLSGDLRLLSMADAGDLTLKLRTVNITELLSDVEETFFEVARDGGVILGVNAPPDLHAQLDPLRVTQILHNLVQNALNHTPRGGLITVAAGLHGVAQLRITVADSGPGIPPEQLERVFDRLYRGDDARSVPGSGLGLSIARTLAEAHGGTLTLESVPGNGTTAVLTVPLNS